MEPRAHHILIGAFSIITVLSGFLFVLWLGSFQIAAQFAYYDIRFKDGVSGLSVGSEVRYNGVKVGEVSRLRFEPDEPGVVYVTARIENRPDFTIRSDSLISLEFLGITGLTYVHIIGGTTNAEMMPVVTDADGALPVIEAQASAIQLLFAGAPEVLLQSQMALAQLNELLGTENRAAIANTLKNIEALTADFAGQSDNIAKTMESVSVLSASLAEASGEFEAVARELKTFISSDARALAADIDATVQSIDRVARLSEAVIAENREAVNAFTGQGLAQVGQLLSETRQLVQSIDRLAGRVESDPAGYLLTGEQGAEFDPKRRAVP